uniref:Uncharacterized protein n=1 Tax=Panagrolaimus sp. ES5 TaxID=591445 RepID=A0AC34F0N1_9BILA
MLPPVIGRIVGVIGEGIMDTFWPQIDSKFNEIQKDFEDHENQIRIFAQQFRGLIQKIRNMCSSEARILKDITKMREQLLNHLNDVTSLNTKIQDTSVHITGYLSTLERQATELQQKKWENERRIEALNENFRSAEERLDTLKSEKQGFESKLSEMKDLVNTQKILMWIPITGWIAAGVIEIGKQIDDFDEKVERAENDIREWYTKMSNLRANSLAITGETTAVDKK